MAEFTNIVPVLRVSDLGRAVEFYTAVLGFGVEWRGERHAYGRGHDPAKWDDFRKRYRAELEEKGDVPVLLKHRATEGAVTFVYAAHDERHNSAVVLKDFLGKCR